MTKKVWLIERIVWRADGSSNTSIAAATLSGLKVAEEIRDEFQKQRGGFQKDGSTYHFSVDSIDLTE